MLLLDRGALDKVCASEQGVLVHVDRELESKDAEHGLQQILVVQDLLAVADVFVEQAVQDWDDLFQLEVLDLVDQVVLVLRTVVTRHGHLFLLQPLGVDVALNLPVDVENDRLRTEPHVGLPLLADLGNLIEELDDNFRPQDLEALVRFLRECVVFLVADQVHENRHATELDNFALVQIV